MLYAGIPRAEGWFRAASVGSGEQQAAGAGGGKGAMERGGGGGCGGPSVSGGGSGGGVGGAGGSSLGGAAPLPLAPGMCSMYSARLAKLVYTCAHHSLFFLLATSPSVRAMCSLPVAGSKKACI